MNNSITPLVSINMVVYSGSKFILEAIQSILNQSYVNFELIIVNDGSVDSTFSWWSAWLNDNPEKIVIAPKVWFGDKYAHLNLLDLIPDSWIIV